MDAAIVVDGVSKMYRLGESRKSMRKMVSGIGRVFRPDRGDGKEQIHWALQDVSFQVEKGQALGIVGRNGAGKTTILKLLSNITRPTSGTISVNGRFSALIELGAGFHPDLTGRENIYLKASILGLSRKEIARKFDRIVEFSGLERFIDTPVKRYSSGMYVRLGFSVSVHVEPEVLLVDEVLSVGDAQFRQRCAQRIGELRRNGVTIVFISHNLPLVRSICDRGIYLEQGRIQAEGEIVTAINAYESTQHQMQIEAMAKKDQDDRALLESSTVDISYIEIRGKDLTDELYYADPLELRVHYATLEPVEKPNLVLRIARSDGVICTMIRTADLGFSLPAIQGKGYISLALDPLQLAGGAYVIDARLLGSLDGIPLAKKHSQWFEVVGPSLGHGDTDGVFVPNIAWVKVGDEAGPGVEDYRVRAGVKPGFED